MDTHDLYADFTFPLESPDDTEVLTNMNDEGVIEILETYLHGIVGAGEDDKPAVELDVYHIRLGIDLSDDTIIVKHDCGNLGLVAGILSVILGNLTS